MSHFQLFPYLPPELRTLIWKAAVPELIGYLPVEVTCHCRVDRGNCGELFFAFLPRGQQLTGRRHVLALKAACRESREEMHTQFPDTLFTINGRLPVNLRRETLFLSGPAPMYMANAVLGARWNILQSMVARMPVSRVAIGVPTCRWIWEHQPQLMFTHFLECMPLVEAIYLVGFQAEDLARICDQAEDNLARVTNWIRSLPGAPLDATLLLGWMQFWVNRHAVATHNPVLRLRLEQLRIKLAKVGRISFRERTREELQSQS